MNCFIRWATGAFDWSRVVLQVGQTSSASRSAALGESAPKAGAATARQQRTSAAKRALTGETGHPVAGENRAGAVVHDREGQLVPIDEAARVTAEVLCVDPEHDEPPIPVRLPDPLEERCLLLARDAPRGPEVHDDGLALELGKSELPFPVEALERELGGLRFLAP
jgi:hypothetical protein